jgi:cell division septation protein DedD
MLRILTPEPYAAGADLERADLEDGTNEFEIVLGKRQLASLAFVVLVLLAVCSGAAYIAGKAAGARETRAVAPKAPTVASPAASPEAATSLNAPQAPNPASTGNAADDWNAKPPSLHAPDAAGELDATLFAEPIPGARYIQVGAVDRGVAVILAEGLRARGFNGFIAPGPKDGIYRVLVGPFRRLEDYQTAKQAVDRMGVATFTRLFERSAVTVTATDTPR